MTLSYCKEKIMERNPLRIVATEKAQINGKNSLKITKPNRRDEMRAKMERLWHQNPESFDPLRNCMERERLERTEKIIKETTSLGGKLVADLGCGGGEFSRRLRDQAATLHAVDVATNALQKLKENDMLNIIPIQDCLPTTLLKDDTYDIVVCTEVIAYLNPDEYRLLFSELSRLIKPNGYVVCSTALDIDTEDPVERFAALAETEFTIEKWVLSYHAFYIRLVNFFEAPSRFVRANRSPEYRQDELNKRKGWKRLWFRWNSSPVLSKFWLVVQWVTAPITSLFRQNKSLMLKMERFCRFLWNTSGISHALFIGKKRPLDFPLPPEEKPRELKHKKQVWE
jgi:2-polyprenyl-3-methyl-5-hydroxy-6-metoxy-1,4-benzoquinol methylase